MNFLSRDEEEESFSKFKKGGTIDAVRERATLVFTNPKYQSEITPLSNLHDMILALDTSSTIFLISTSVTMKILS